jgi:hypothetical protein
MSLDRLHDTDVLPIAVSLGIKTESVAKFTGRGSWKVEARAGSELEVTGTLKVKCKQMHLL